MTPLLGVDISLAWDHSTGVPEYRIYEQTGTTWTIVKSIIGTPVAPTTAVISNVTATAHTYRVTAFNAPWESVPSNILTIAGPPPAPTGFRITQPLSAITVPKGDTAVFFVQAEGPEPITYQWRDNKNKILKETGSTLILTNIKPGQEGIYSVIIKQSPLIASSARLTISR